MDERQILQQELTYTTLAYAAMAEALEDKRNSEKPNIKQEESTSFLKKRSKKLLLPWLRRLKGNREAYVVSRSPYMDKAWYKQTNPNMITDPATHYVYYGAAEGRDPGPIFSSEKYLLANPDVAAAGVNPLVHYETFGRAEGRALRPPHQYDIVFVSGEPGTPGHIYRVRRPAEAASAAGLRSRAISLTDAAADPDRLDAKIVVIWRAAWNDAVAAVIAGARRAGARIVFDVDDLMIEPDLATFELIDGIRTQALTEQVVRDFYGQVQQTLRAADAALSPTAFLTERLQRFGKPGFVLPNGFDDETLRVSQAAVAARTQAGPYSRPRLGYAGGTRTHQKDFAVIANPVARVLRDDAQRRLVVFRRAGTPCLDIGEFPALDGLEDQIEWREMVGLQELPWELARFDVNLAPLEVGNPYCEAKSELKFFEAALVGVPTIASPTQPFRDAIRDGENGFLAANEAVWYERMTALLVDRGLRSGLAATALRDVMSRYGIEQRASLIRQLISDLSE